MNRAQKLAARLLESDPDEFDPKAELMKVDPDTIHWLERNGFASSLNDGWWHKQIGGDHYNVRWPLRDGVEARDNGWTLSMVHLRKPTVEIPSNKPFYNLSSADLKDILVKFGAAQP